MASKKKDEPVVEKLDTVEATQYSVAEIKYRGELLCDLVNARNVRESAHDEFDGMTYIQRCESNRKLANTYIQPKKNKEDTNYTKGTVRSKIEAYQSYISNLSLSVEVRAYNSKDIQDVELGSAMEDIIEKTNELDGDDELKSLRQYTLLEQGEVYVQEVCEEVYENKKKVDTPFDGLNIKDFKFTETRVKKDMRLRRKILLNENVYKGDITIYNFRDQPFVFTVEQIPYAEAEAIYGSWSRWKNVPRQIQFFSDPVPATLYNNNYSMTELQAGQCEVLKVQKRLKNEYAIIINGVLMTPVGLPLPRVWGKDGTGVEYNITEQIMAFNPFFGYGKGIPARLKTKVYIEDEMRRLGILKTQQSFQPPRANNTGIILSSKTFMPGKILNGIDGTKITNIGDTSGVSKSEMQMMSLLQADIDNDAITPQALAGQPVGTSGGRISATQSLQAKNNAELMMTLSVFAVTMLEKKCGDLRLYNVLENWFDPIDKSIDLVRSKLANKYRSVTLNKFIDGAGPGQSKIEVSDDKEDPIAIYKKEKRIEQATGIPTRIKVINPVAIKANKYSFYTVVTSKPKKTSDVSKVLFNDMITQAKDFFPNLNLPYLEERFAMVWGENPTKMFTKQQGQQDPNNPDPNADPAAGGGAPTGKPGARGKMINKNMTGAGKGVKPTLNTAAGVSQ